MAQPLFLLLLHTKIPQQLPNIKFGTNHKLLTLCLLKNSINYCYGKLA